MFIKGYIVIKFDIVKFFVITGLSLKWLYGIEVYLDNHLLISVVENMVDANKFWLDLINDESTF